MDLLGLGEKILGFGNGLWRRYRFGPRGRLSWSWQHLPIISLDRPDPSWRAVSIEVTSSKGEEFVIASGSIEFRPPRGKWTTLTKLTEVLNLPIEVPANRQWTGEVSGESL